MKDTKGEWDIRREIRHDIYTKFRLYTRLRRFEHGGRVWKTVAKIVNFYIDNIRKLRTGTELVSYSVAIYLVNMDRLIGGIITGVIGIILTDKLSKFEIKLEAKKISNNELWDHEKEKRERRRREIR